MRYTLHIRVTTMLEIIMLLFMEICHKYPYFNIQYMMIHSQLFCQFHLQYYVEKIDFHTPL